MHIEQNYTRDLAVAFDRALFLDSLQVQEPTYWRGLQRSMSLAPSDRPTAQQWATLAGVKDEWLMEVVDNTAAHWQAHPAGGCSCLRGDRLFVYNLDHEAVPTFSPLLDTPVPLRKGRQVETEDEFRNRIEKQFRQQLSEYVKSTIRPICRSRLPRSGQGERWKHAAWTALYWTGRTVPEIVAASSPTFDGGLPAAIYKAVTRYAASIDLTINKR